MYKKTITYTDYDGVERTEDFYFNLSKAEVAEMNLSTKGGLDVYIKRIVAAKDVPEVAALFKDIIVKSYGIKSDDGKRFIKNPEVTAEFLQTEAYSDLYWELCTNDESASEFVNGILPKIPQDHKAISK